MSEGQTCNTPMKTDSCIAMIGREALRALIQVEIESDSEAAQREKMRSLSWNLAEIAICDIFLTAYCVANQRTNNSSLSCVENVIMETIHRRVLDKTLNQSLYSWPQFDTTIKIWIKKIHNDRGGISHSVTFVRKRIINAEEKKLRIKPQMAKEIPSPLGRSLSATAKTKRDKELKARRSRHTRQDLKDQK